MCKFLQFIEQKKTPHITQLYAELNPLQIVHGFNRDFLTFSGGSGWDLTHVGVNKIFATF